MPADAGYETKSGYVHILKRCLAQVYAFFENTSIHGVKYLAEFRRPHFERILWLLSVTLAVIVCGYLIRQSWEARLTRPVILAMDKKQRPVWDIPFPAITICPTEKIRTTVDQQNKDVLCASSLVCETPSVSDCKNASNIIKAMTVSAPQPHEIFVSNEYFSMSIFLGGSINQTAQPLLASGGLCYSFNMLPGSSIFVNNTFHSAEKYLDYNESVNWDIEDGYKSNEYPGSYPRRALGSGDESGLLMLLKKEAAFNVSHTCGFIHGFELQVHSPIDFPSGERKYYAPLNSMVQVFVTPEEVITDDLRSYTPEQRQCYYPDEHKLEFFKVYSQKNCELECFSKVALECCGCVAFFMPRVEDTPVCLEDEAKACIFRARETMKINASGVTYTGYPPCPDTNVKCSCLPSCTQLSYRHQVAHSKLDRKQLEDLYRVTYGVNSEEESDFTIIQVFYTDSHFIPFRRLELYGIVELLASCGGVLGLCLGFSALSIVELLYWLVVRPFHRERPVRDVSKEPEGTHLTSL